MLDSKFFFTLIGLIISVFAICNTNMSPSINEGFWGTPGRALKVMREVHPSKGRAYSVKNNYQSMLGNDKFVSRPSFQGRLSPRFTNTDLGANIRYNLPSYSNQASPSHPLAFGDMAKEGYQDTYGVAKCGKGGVSLGQTSLSAPVPVVSSDINYQTEMKDIYNSDHTTPIISDGLVQVSDMTTINALGQDEQSIVYDRFIYANKKSNGHAQGDFIRGDLAIAPCGGNWFSVHPNPLTDLNRGALNVIGGNGSENADAMASLINATSAGYENIIAGVDINMSNQFSTNTSAGGGDIHITSFA